MTFRDHFSAGSAGYARFRPRYPDALFAWLAGQAPAREQAVDVATGTGQAAVALASLFRRTHAFDASAAQIRQATLAPDLTYAVAPAEAIPMPAASTHLLTVAQALHWLDLDRFYAEARRILVPGGLLAVWTYNRLTVDRDVDAVVEHLYMDIVGTDWPAERQQVESGYRDLPFPFSPVEVPAFTMGAEWDAGELLGYLATWSAVHRHRERTGNDPLALIAGDLRRHFGPGRRPVRWPLAIRAGRP
ncbi:MAG: class I SAM-dependent methyltransferase [Pseudomonadota bacterium]